MITFHDAKKLILKKELITLLAGDRRKGANELSALSLCDLAEMFALTTGKPQPKCIYKWYEGHGPDDPSPDIEEEIGIEVDVE